MESNDLPGLTDAIAEYMNRDDLTSQIPSYINFAQVKLNLELRLPQMLTSVSSSTSSTTINMPADCLAIYNLVLTDSNGNQLGRNTLQFVSEDDATILRNTGIGNGWEQYYTLFGNTIELINISSTTPIYYKLRYYQQIPTLTTGSPTNWLITIAPHLYLYSSLLEASVYLVEQQANISTWVQGRQMAIDALNIAGDQLRFPQGNLNSRIKAF